jgi:hypothetical protein
MSVKLKFEIHKLVTLVQNMTLHVYNKIHVRGVVRYTSNLKVGSGTGSVSNVVDPLYKFGFYLYILYVFVS